MNVRHARRTARLLAALAAVGLLAAACGGDDTPTAEEATPDATATGDAGTEAATGGETGGEAVEVTAADYAFEGVPETLAAGTSLSLTNSSTEELHELVAFKLPEGETRSAEELFALGETEFNAIVAGPPTMVLIAPPGGAPSIPAVGDGTLAEPGRYVFGCFIPQGADPQEYMEAAQAATDGPPNVSGTGPPHVVLGMFAETTVE